MSGELVFKQLSGKQINEHIDEVAKFRIRYFKDFPYLYIGNTDYERKYLQGYSQDDHSILIKLLGPDNSLKAVSTGLPLNTKSDILDGASDMFRNEGYEPQEIYYYGEIILDYSVRGQGLSRKIYQKQDEFAKSKGFSKIAIATVVRDDSDSRKPFGYFSSDLVWTNLGFSKTPIEFEYHWPTIQSDGSVSDILNPMVYWIKSL